MADQLRDTESGTRGVRRILRKQTDKAVEALEEGGRPLSDEAVHTARKQMKKVRAGLRLLCETLGTRAYDQENGCVRDAARPLTEVRDAGVLVNTLGKLADRFRDEIDRGAVSRLRQELLDHQREVRRSVLEDGTSLAPVKLALEGVRERSGEWPVGKKGWAVLGPGLRRTYKRGRDAFEAARQVPSTENLHEWRKQVKYLWHQLRTLVPLRPDVIGKLVEQAHTLGEHLGDDHDLAVLREKLEGELASDDRAPLFELIDRRRAELQEQALALGPLLYAEKPGTFAERFKSYWRGWRDRAPAAAHA